MTTHQTPTRHAVTPAHKLNTGCGPGPVADTAEDESKVVAMPKAKADSTMATSKTPVKLKTPDDAFIDYLPLDNENSNPKLVLAGKLATTTASELGATNVALTRLADNVTIEVRFAGDAIEAANEFRSRIPAEFNPSIEHAHVFFAVPYSVVGDHGKVGTYTNHKCKGPLCRVAWRADSRGGKVARHARLLADFNSVPHGLHTTYANYACRCEACKAAWSADARERKQRARLKKIVVMTLKAGGTITSETLSATRVQLTATVGTAAAAFQIAKIAHGGWQNVELNDTVVVFDVEADLARRSLIWDELAAAAG